MNSRYRYALLVLVFCATPVFVHAQIEIIPPNLNLVLFETAIKSVGETVGLPTLTQKVVVPDAGEKALKQFVANFKARKERAHKLVERLASRIEELAGGGNIVQPNEVLAVSAISDLSTINLDRVVKIATEIIDKTITNGANVIVALPKIDTPTEENVAAPISAIKNLFSVTPVATSTSITLPPVIINRLDQASLARISSLENLVNSLRSTLTKQSDKNVTNLSNITNNIVNNFTVSTGIFSSNVSIAGILSLTGGTTTATSGFNLSTGCFSINNVCVTNSSGGGGTANSKFATSTNGFTLYPNGGTSRALVLGGTATTTTGALLEVLGGLYTSGSSTLQRFTATHSTTTNATTTNFFATTASSTNLFASLLKIGDGAANVPSITFAAATNVGLFRAGAASIGVADGNAFLLAAGTAAVPGMAFVDSLATGLYRVADNRLGFSTAGAARWEISATGHLIAATDNNYDIGASGATRPRNLFVGTGITTANLLVTASTTLQNFTSSNSTSTNSTTTGYITASGNIAMGGATSNQIFFGGNGAAVPGVNSAGAKIQLFGAIGANGTGDYSIGVEASNLWFNSPSGFKWYVGGVLRTTLDTNGLFSTPNLLLTGSSTLQRFTATHSTTTNATTTNFFSTLASTTDLFAGSVTIGNNLSFINNATTTISTGTTGTNWVIATTTNILAIPIISFAANGATSTISMFGATTTGITAGIGTPLPAALKNQLIVGNGKDQAHIAIVNGSLCLDNDGWCTASTTAGRIAALGQQIAASDLAEAYHSLENLEAGDVVSSAGGTSVEKSTQDNREFMMGVVSTEPGIVLGLNTDQNLSTPGMFPIALSGRVPTKVNTENGAIVAGDYLALSSTQGVAAKATKAGIVIGQALGSYSGSGVGKVMTFVKNTYYSGISADKLPGLSSVGGLPDSKQILVSLMSGGLSTAGGPSRISTDTLLAGIEIITPKLTAYLVQADIIESPTIDALVARITNLENITHTPTTIGSVIESINEWIGQKITAVLGIFDRLETKTVKITESLEITDSATGNVYCVTIKNGEWDKLQGACGSTPISVSTPTPEPSPPVEVVEPTPPPSVEEPAPSTPENPPEAL